MRVEENQGDVRGKEKEEGEGKRKRREGNEPLEKANDLKYKH